MFVGPLLIGLLVGATAATMVVSAGGAWWMGLSIYVFGGAAAAFVAAITGCALSSLRRSARAVWHGQRGAALE